LTAGGCSSEPLALCRAVKEKPLPGKSCNGFFYSGDVSASLIVHGNKALHIFELID